MINNCCTSLITSMGMLRKFCNLPRNGRRREEPDPEALLIKAPWSLLSALFSPDLSFFVVRGMVEGGIKLLSESAPKLTCACHRVTRHGDTDECMAWYPEYSCSKAD